MADVVTRLVVESKEYDSKIARATSGLTQFEKKCREVGGTLEFVEKEDIDFVKALGQMDTVATTATGKLGELKKAFTELSVQYKNLTDEEKKSPYGQALAGSLDQIKGRIGTLSGQISSVNGELAVSGTVFEKLGGKMGIPAEAIGKLGASFASLGPAAAAAATAVKAASGKIGLVIAAIVTAVKQLIDAFKRNEDAMEGINKIAAPFKAIWQSVQRIFDDLVKTFVDVYSNIEKAVGGFSAFRVVLSPVAAAIAAVRAGLAVIGTLLTDTAKGVAFVADKIRGAMAGSKVQSFFQGITDTVQGFFTKFTGWVEKLANSSLGKKLGLDSLYTQLKEILHTQGELTESNRKIAQQENELNKLRRSTNTANTNREADISELRAKASDKSSYSADERVGFLEKAMDLEKKSLEANIALRTKEYELIKLKNSLTQTGTQDLDAENEALNNITRARTEYNNQVRAMQRQLQSAKKEAAGGGSTVGETEAGPSEGSIAWQEKEVARLTELWKNATGEGVAEYKRQLDEAKKVLDEMTGKTQEVASTTSGPQLSNFEKLQESIRLKLAEQNFQVDQNSLTNLMTVAIQNGIDGLDINFENLQSQLAEGLNIPDEAWEQLTDQINEKLADLGIDPIALNVDTGAIKQADKDVKGTINHVEGAASAFNSLADAMNGIEDPRAKVGGMIAQAIASVAAGYGAANAQAAAQGPWAWIAFAITGLATMITTIAGIKQATAGSYAEGGIIPGNSYSGDNLTANVNSGELILNRSQQDSIAGQLQGGGAQTVHVTGMIKGSDMYLVQANYAKEQNLLVGTTQGAALKIQ